MNHFKPNIFNTILVDKVNNLINGDATVAINIIGLTATILIASDFWSAIRFGTSSPNTNVKKDNKIVIPTKDIWCAYGTCILVKATARLSEIPVAADALAKKLDKVMEMVYQNQLKDRQD